MIQRNLLQLCTIGPGLGLARGYETSNMVLVRLPCGETMRATAMPVTVILYLKYEHHTLCFLRPYIGFETTDIFFFLLCHEFAISMYYISFARRLVVNRILYPVAHISLVPDSPVYPLLSTTATCPGLAALSHESKQGALAFPLVQKR